MNRNGKLPTVLILLSMMLIGAMYWVDLTYYTDARTGFVIQGAIWMRYAVLVLPLAMGLLGMRLLGAGAVGVMRLRHRRLALLFTLGAVVGVASGVTFVVYGFMPLSVYRIVLGLLFVWFGVWMFLAALQLFVQVSPTPTNSAIWGILAALPFCLITIHRVLTKPTSLYRIAPLVRNLSALFAMLWVGMFLRALYIALTRRRVKWMYLFGIYTFLFGTCFELPQAIHSAMLGTNDPLVMLEAVNMGMLGIVAGCVSVALAEQGGPRLRRQVYHRGSQPEGEQVEPATEPDGSIPSAPEQPQPPNTQP